MHKRGLSSSSSSCKLDKAPINYAHWRQQRYKLTLKICTKTYTVNTETQNKSLDVIGEIEKNGSLSVYYAVVRCLSVTFVSCVKTNKHIFKIVSPSGSQAIQPSQFLSATLR